MVRMKKALLAVPVLALTLTSGLMLLYGQSSGRLRDQLVGTWRLVSSSQRLADGSTRPDPQTGPRGSGYLVYARDGQMCVVVGNPERPRWASAQAPTEAELREAFGGLVAYCGTFEVNQTDSSVTHHIEVDKVPNSTGTERKRFCSFSGNRLVLSAAPPLPPGVKEWTIVWERVSR